MHTHACVAVYVPLLPSYSSTMLSLFLVTQKANVYSTVHNSVSKSMRSARDFCFLGLLAWMTSSHQWLEHETSKQKGSFNIVLQV